MNRVVVLVEGESDRRAVHAAAAKDGRSLAGEGVDVVAMGGVTNLARFLAELVAAPRLSVLCDAGEAPFVARTMRWSGRDPRSELFVCDRDLEDELIRALGAEATTALIEREGELDSLRTLQQMPFHRDRTIDQHLRRFVTCRSGRKHRYAPLFVDALAPDALPRPLRDLLGAVRDGSTQSRGSSIAN